MISNTPQPGESTEWIVEAPSVPGIGVGPLADFGNLHFGYCLWTDDYTDPANSTAYTIAQGVSPSTASLHQTQYYGSSVFDVNAAPNGGLDGDHQGFSDSFSLTERIQ